MLNDPYLKKAIKEYFESEPTDAVALDLSEYSLETMCTYITHPDQREGEVFIGNFHNPSVCGWKTKRVSDYAFDSTGHPLNVGTLAIFAQAKEIMEAGVKLKTEKE